MLRKYFSGMLMTALMVAGLTAVTSAQMMRMSPEDRAKALKDSLALDSTQTAKAVVVLKEAQKAMTDVFQSGSDDREAMRASMTDISKKADEKIKAFLTDAQKKKYEEMIKNRPARGMRPRNN
jgi:protein CpxP